MAVKSTGFSKSIDESRRKLKQDEKLFKKMKRQLFTPAKVLVYQLETPRHSIATLLSMIFCGWY